MKREVSQKAYAKVNLFLEITGRRPDGYHLLESVMQTLSLCDDVTVSLSEKEGVSLFCSDPSLPSGADNLACRAVSAFEKEFGWQPQGGISIHLEKRIPSAAGLGGGSADAAAVLRCLEELSGFADALPEAERSGHRSKMLHAALTLGADVPFCLVGGTQKAEGIGELLTALPSPPADWNYVLARGSEPMPTGKAYARLDETDFRPVPSEGVLSAFRSGSAEALLSVLFNRFETVVPVETTIREILQKSGAMRVLLCGSGSAVCGIFDDPEKAKTAVTLLREKQFFAETAKAQSKLW